MPNILTVAGAVGSTLLNQTNTTLNGNVVTTGSTSPLTTTLQTAAATSILQSTGALAGFATGLGSNAILAAVINAVNTDDQSNLLSVPSIITHDGSTANFLVGQEIPITTGEALSNNFDNAFRTTQREEVGIKLEVTPQVNSSGEVRLAIRQEVSSIAGAVGTNSTDIILNKRSFDTVLTVDDGDIAAIGGLLDDNERFTLQKIPLLGDLPLIGALFRSKSKTRNKTNLVVFIRPTILRSREETAAVAARRWDGVRRVQLDRRPGEEPALDQLARDYMGAVPPGGYAVQQPGDLVIEGYDAAGRPLPPGTVVNVPIDPLRRDIERPRLPAAGPAMMDAAVIPDPDTVARSDRAPDAAGPLPAERLPSLEARHDLPYGFAREHGLVRIDDDRVALREGADPRRLLEARRRLGHGFAVEVVDATTFDRHLSDHYAIDGQAMGLAGEIGGRRAGPGGGRPADRRRPARQRRRRARHPPGPRHHRGGGAARRVRHPC